MTPQAAIFYLLGAITVAATILAITRRNLVHALVYLVISFFATAMLFYLLGAPLLAALEVIIYAGAIMVLFLFIIMLLQVGPSQESRGTLARQWWPAAILAGLCLAALLVVLPAGSIAQAPLQAAMVSPLEFGRFLFRQYWLPVEIASLLLLVALVGALYLGRRETAGPPEEQR